jgi:aarF domain-containing kinase
MLDLPKRAARSARVAYTGGRIYLGYKRTQRRVRGWPQPRADAEWANRHDDAARRIYGLAVSLKGMYVKVGQFVGTRTDIFPEAYITHLGQLQDAVPPRPLSQVLHTIEDQYGQPASRLFARFDETPIASASLAQVHRAALPDGREVAVKVQHPEVAALVKLDVRNLQTMAGIVARREPNFDYRAIAAEIGRQVPLELDFVREADMTRRITRNLRTIPGIVVPPVVDDLVRPKVLVLEYLEGKRMFAPGQAIPDNIDGPAIAATITEAFGHQIMFDGLFQADPHPGNLLLMPDGLIALLDFGLTKELPGPLRLGFCRLVIAVAERDMHGVSQSMDDLGVRTRSDDPADVMRLLRLFFGPREAGLTSGGFAGRRREALARNPVEALPEDLILLGRVIGLLRGVCTSLGAPLTPMQMLRPHAERALAAAK